ncbi:hypothetical protein [Streptomyces sp. NPDC057939]|uniref:hypothetical protein n=1 Tax=Streptomyces sp. NPDC057939 TaxID=3346284 RepID=UPI0036E3AD0B
MIRKDATTNRPAAPASSRARPRFRTARPRELSADTAIADCTVMPFILINSAWNDSRMSSGTARNVGTRLAAP